MCSRYTIGKTKQELIEKYDAALDFDFTPNYNLAPTQLGLVITSDEPKLIQPMHFGLVPVWAKETKLNFSTLNARSEEVLEKKTYAPLVQKHQTCLIITDGFYEWDKKSGKPVPFYFSLKDRDVFCFAGLYTTRSDGYNSFTIMTTASNNIVGKIHDPKFRMPVILEKNEESLWLSKDLPVNDLLKLCDKYPDDLMQVWEVDPKVNNVRADGPTLNKSV